MSVPVKLGQWPTMANMRGLSLVRRDLAWW